MGQVHHQHNQILSEDLELLIDRVFLGGTLHDKRATEALIRLKTHREVLAKRKENATVEELKVIKEITKAFQLVK